jgi:hypothetical protein
MKGFAMRDRLVTLLEGHGAHISFSDALEGFPEEHIGTRVPLLAHTAWQLVVHMYRVQRDIVEFIDSPQHSSPEYPSGFWPEEDGPAEVAQWYTTIRGIESDLRGVIERVKNPETDLFEPFPHGDGHNLFHEAVTLADHNSYHIGQLVDLRMLLGVPVRDW